MVHAQKKGKLGENQFCKWLDEKLYNNDVATRNYNQADGHSSDVITKDFLFEVKRQETLNFGDWWYQVSVAVKRLPGNLIPVVAFRQNRKNWEFLIPAKIIGVELGYIHLNETVFLSWAREIANFQEELTEGESEIVKSLEADDFKSIRKSYFILGHSKKYLADKFNVSIKVIDHILETKENENF